MIIVESYQFKDIYSITTFLKITVSDEILSYTYKQLLIAIAQYTTKEDKVFEANLRKYMASVIVANTRKIEVIRVVLMATAILVECLSSKVCIIYTTQRSTQSI